MMKLTVLRGLMLATICWASSIPLCSAAEQVAIAAESKLSDEVAALRAELSELGTDVQRLLELMQADKKENETAVNAAEPPKDDALQAEPHHRPAEIGFVDMTLDECNKIALQNTNADKNDGNQQQAVCDAYWDFWVANKKYETLNKSRESAHDYWRLALANFQLHDPIGGEIVVRTRAMFQQFAAQLESSLHGSNAPGNDDLGIYGHEDQLCQAMGWQPLDGRMVRPVDESVIEPLQLEWEEVLAQTLINNQSIRTCKSRIRELETELMVAKKRLLPNFYPQIHFRELGVGETSGPAELDELKPRLALTPHVIGERHRLVEIQNNRTELARLKETLRETEVQVSDSLSVHWRKLESNFNSMQDYRDQIQANQDEIRIYRDQLGNAPKNETATLIDLLLRAEERLARSELQYFQAIGEYKKSTAAIERLRGSIDLAATSLEDEAEFSRRLITAQERELANVLLRLPDIEFVAVHLDQQASRGTQVPSVSCHLDVKGKLDTKISEALLAQIASQSISGLQIEDVSVGDLNSDVPRHSH